MQPFMKNVAVEYVAKALPDSELAQALTDLQNGKTTIEEVTTLIEDGTVSNAKPLYFHPITIYVNTTGYKCLLSMFIINNVSTQFTPETLAQYLINSNGKYLVNGNYQTDNYYLSPCIVAKTGDTGLSMVGFDTLGNLHSETNSVINFHTILNDVSPQSFADDVNKIN